MAKGSSRKDIPNEEISFNPFQEILGNKTQTPEALNERVKVPLSEPQHSANKCSGLSDNLFPTIEKISMRIERKGRRGKTVTLMDVSPLPSPDAFSCLLKILKKTLGCGAAIDGNSRIMVQGDQRTRLEKWLTEHGVTNIVRG